MTDIAKAVADKKAAEMAKESKLSKVEFEDCGDLRIANVNGKFAGNLPARPEVGILPRSRTIRSLGTP